MVSASLPFTQCPNLANDALASFEKECKVLGKQFTFITQNVDGLHQRTDSMNVIELHGSLDKISISKSLIPKAGTLENGANTENRFAFQGPASQTLPKALNLAGLA
ncbi:NAD-dependent protein deacylase sirtuin-5 [Tropilaelaps mercedesae]|uniref:NAD-dependent protein deacylase sirtuin-5 n=1 Tax=Tropilaelaps mercedesae TaxID=418985 RepID=A0A1V9X770_9ACAR|nr:NAD-dependent protein deacylase sirtuin-5 [Tropilaelaps mercedesae]